MWPWGHAAVGYLGYVTYRRLTDGVVPEESTVLAVVLGTQFPDIIDKPLSWTIAILPAGRSLAHSALTAGLVLSVVWVLAGWSGRRDARSLVAAFGFGWLSHIVADGFRAMWNGVLGELTYAVWPLLPLPDYEESPGIIAHFRELHATPSVLAGAGLFVIAVGVWWRLHGPGSTAAPTVEVEGDRTR